MNETSVTRDAWADIAEELHRIADDLHNLIGQPVPGLFALNIQPHNADAYRANTVKGRPITVAAVDAVANVLLGKAAESYPCGGGFHHGVDGKRGRVTVQIYTSVADPDAVDPEEEITRLRAEVAELRSKAPDASGFGYSRADDNVPAEDMTLTQPGRIEPHNGGMTEGGLVDETAREVR